ncbi:MAG TPA: DoxX family protein [Gemmatimonadales bacterium]|jgi:putative oxidoreductase|nr:DoxX family protein [Gemmatimonadales bacterium]
MILALQDSGAAPSAALAVEFVIGRVLFSAMFIMSGIQHLTKLQMMSQYAASQKVPAPKVAVGVTGLMLIAGGLSILLGVQVPLGTALLVVFLIPTAFFMHRFWGLADPMQAAVQRAHFMKNITLAGAALLICYFTSVAPGAWVYVVGGR